MPVGCVPGKSAVDPPALLILQPSNCTEGVGLQHSSPSTVNMELNSMFVPVVCITGKSAVDPPFLLIFQPSNCTDGGGLQHSPPSTEKLFNIHIHVCQKQFRRSFSSFHVGFSANWSWKLEKRRRCCKAQTITTYLHPVQLIFAGPTLLPGKAIMHMTGLEFLLCVFPSCVCHWQKVLWTHPFC